MDRLRKFWLSSRREKWLLCEAIFLLLFSNLCLAIIPFKYIHNALSRRYDLVSSDACEAAACASKIELIELSISRAANTLPWNTPCLSRSIAAFIMFRRRGIPAVLLAGVKVLEDSSLTAHAWVDTGDKASKKSLQNSEFSVVIRIGKAIHF